MYLAVVQRIKDGWLRTGGGFERRAPVTVTYGLPIEFRRRRRLSACCQIYNCPHLGAARCRSRAVTAPRLLGWLSSGSDWTYRRNLCRTTLPTVDNHVTQRRDRTIVGRHFAATDRGEVLTDDGRTTPSK